MIANNKRAKHEYSFEKIYEAGIELKGTEVKSIRRGNVSIQESYVHIHNGEAWLVGLHISPYEQGNIQNVDPVRDRRLLLHKKEIQQLKAGVERDGFTIVPLSVNIRRGLVKLDIALAKGKKLYDKRQALKEQDDRRRMEQSLKKYR